MNYQKIGKLIQIIRRGQGITQGELARKADVSASYLSELENGKVNNPSLEKAVNLASALGVKISDLIGNEIGAETITELNRVGITQVFHSSGTEKAEEEIREALTQTLKKDGEKVCLAEITSSRFFHFPALGGTWELEIRKLIENGVKLQVILLDPRAEDAFARAELDRKYGYDLHGEIFGMMRRIIELADRYSNVKLGLLKFHHLARIFLTGETAFYQPYHFGARDDPKEGEEKAVSGMPLVTKAEKDTKFYNLVQLQFESLWEQAEKVTDKNQAKAIIAQAEAIKEEKVESWEKVNKGIEKLYQEIERSGYKPDVIVCIDRSGAIVGGALALNLMDLWKAEFQVLKRDYKKKRHGIRPVEVYDTLTTDLHDKKVLLVDSELREVRSMEKAIDIIRKKDPKELQTACLYVTGKPRQRHLSKVDFHVYEIDDVRTMPWIYNEGYLDIY